jgi:hypothetical protein
MGAAFRTRFTAKAAPGPPTSLIYVHGSGSILEFGWNAPMTGVPDQFHDYTEKSTDGITWTSDTLGSGTASASIYQGNAPGIGRTYSDEFSDDSSIHLRFGVYAITAGVAGPAAVVVVR